MGENADNARKIDNIDIQLSEIKQQLKRVLKSRKKELIKNEDEKIRTLNWIR
jgi:hypothetical protein